jgi:integrase
MDTAKVEIAVPAAPKAAPEQAVREFGHPFEWCSRTYIDAQAPGWKSGKHAKQWLATLQKYAFPVIGTLDVATITNSHITTILQPIWSTKTETATRVRGRMECILDWATHKGYRHGANPARWEGNLQHELPSPTKLKKRKQRHHPALPYTRLGAFMVDLSLREGMSARALEWGILNASRFQEIAGARRREVDLLLKRWTIPPERMKREIEHVVPLSDEAISLFESLPPGNPDDLLFPAPEGGQLSDSALGAMIDGIHESDLARGGMGYMDPKEGRIATQHGFRSNGTALSRSAVRS